MIHLNGSTGPTLLQQHRTARANAVRKMIIEYGKIVDAIKSANVE